MEEKDIAKFPKRRKYILFLYFRIFCLLRSFLNLNSIIDLSDVKSIYENSDLVVIGTIEEKEYFIPDKQDYVVTHGKLEIERIIKGYNSGGMIDFYMTGGFLYSWRISK